MSISYSEETNDLFMSKQEELLEEGRNIDIPLVCCLHAALTFVPWGFPTPLILPDELCDWLFLVDFSSEVVMFILVPLTFYLWNQIFMSIQA